MKVVQVLPTLGYGDAVGNDVRALRTILSAAGYDESVYAGYIGPHAAQRGVYQAPDLWPEFESDDVIIYHMSIGWDDFSLVKQAPCKKIAIYHNVTPARFFAEYDLTAYKNCLRGLQSVIEARDVFDYVIADSAFNRSDLLSYGYTCPIDIMPVIIPYEDYHKRPAGSVIRRYQNAPGHNIVYVGRIAPNKKCEDIIAAFSLYQRNYDAQARLFLVGGYEPTDGYYQRLLSYVASLGVRDVTFTGHIPFANILAYYTLADVVVCMSEHEGFCVPLVEAMLFQKPIVAFDSCAVGDTLGPGGLLMTNKDSQLVAGAIDRVISDSDLRQKLLEGQAHQLDRFSYPRIRKQFLSLFEGFLTSMAGEEMT